MEVRGLVMIQTSDMLGDAHAPAASLQSAVGHWTHMHLADMNFMCLEDMCTAKTCLKS